MEFIAINVTMCAKVGPITRQDMYRPLWLFIFKRTKMKWQPSSGKRVDFKVNFEFNELLTTYKSLNSLIIIFFLNLYFNQQRKVTQYLIE